MEHPISSVLEVLMFAICLKESWRCWCFFGCQNPQNLGCESSRAPHLKARGKHHQDPCQPSQLPHLIRNRSSTTSKWWTAKDLKYMFEHIVKQRSMNNLYLPPGKLSWNLKKTPWKGKISTNQHFSVSMWNFGGVILGTYSIHVWYISHKNQPFM